MTFVRPASGMAAPSKRLSFWRLCHNGAARLRPSASFLTCSILVGFVLTCAEGWAQAGFDDDRVMIQGYYWESYRHGHPENEKFRGYGEKTWYSIVRENADRVRSGHFDLIWLPPPSHAAQAGQYSAGYNPKENYWLSN